jgi:NitT/TauT family transport system permease protein
MSTNRLRSALVWLVGVYLVWEAAAWTLVALHDPMAAVKLPYFHDVVATFAAHADTLTEAAAVTFGQAALGFVLGAAVGYVLAVLMSVSRTAERIAYPYLILSQMIPVLGLAPIIFNLVRDMDASRVVIAAYITFFPVAANALSGFRATPADTRQLMHSYAAGKPTTYAKLLIPFSLPYLFAGLKIAAPLSVTASILVDMLGSKNGIGVKLIYALYGGQSDVFWAAVLTSAAMGIVSYLVIAGAEKLLVPWKRPV